MSLQSQVIITQINLLFFAIVPLIIFYVIIVFLSNIIGKMLLKHIDRVALVYAAIMRNWTIVLGLSINSFRESLAVFIIAIGYIVQLPIAALYMRMNVNRK